MIALVLCDDVTGGVQPVIFMLQWKAALCYDELTQSKVQNDMPIKIIGPSHPLQMFLYCKEREYVQLSRL